MMTQYFPIIVEQESNGTVTAWVAGLPGVYAAGDTVSAAKRGIRHALAAHLAALGTLGREPQLTADVTVLRHSWASGRSSAEAPVARRRRHRGVTAARAADPQRVPADPTTPGSCEILSPEDSYGQCDKTERDHQPDQEGRPREWSNQHVGPRIKVRHVPTAHDVVAAEMQPPE
jgi:predicted RNase H-like HicB family nuclease